MRYVSLFDGIGAAHAAWMPLGWECLWTAEIEKFPIAVVERRCPGIPNLGDVTAITEEMLRGYPKPDLVIGGSPCQSFSVAGLRGGLADPRGNLALRFVQLVGALAPRWVVWENVPGVLSSGSGRDFGSILGALAELGYGWAYRVLDAQYFGVAQRRRRVFLVATSAGDWRRAAAVLSVGEGMRGDPAPSRTPRQGPAADAGQGASGASWWDGGQLSQTLDAVVAKGQTMPEKNRFPAVLEPFVKAKRAQSAADDESWKEGEVSPTLNHFDVGDTRATTVVAFTQNQRDEVRDLGDTAGALNGPGTHQSTYVAEAFSVREDAKANNFSATPAEVGLAVQSLRPSPQSHHAQIFIAEAGFETFQGGSQQDQVLTANSVCPALCHSSNGNKGHHQPKVMEAFPMVQQAVGFSDSAAANTYGVAYTEEGTPPLRGGAGGNTIPSVATPTAVRRLTPLECERLQGFPDGWTQIPWRKKPAEECPDGPRYRALGNSMAVPVIRWIGERIAKSHQGSNNLKDDAC